MSIQLKQEDEIMNFLWTTIHVKNMEASVDFYQQVIGLTIDSRFQAGAGVECC